MSWHNFNTSNKTGTCKWCGRKLRRPKTCDHVQVSACCDAPIQRTGKFLQLAGMATLDRRGMPEVVCSECSKNANADHRTVKKNIQPLYDKPGDYGDGHFCGLRCGHQFGVAAANSGTRLVSEEG